MGLENLVKKLTRNMIISDVHFPYQDNDALEVMKLYAKKYKPDNFVINGDLLDFYTLSTFDKNPERKRSVQEEIDEGSYFLKDMRKLLGPKCKMYMTEGNHENRLQRFMFRNPELSSLRDLALPKLMRLKQHNVKYVGVDSDYWKDEIGHIKLGDAIVTHGDNRLNGCRTSQYAGYSAKNTMLNGMQSSVVIGHVHRLANVKHSSPYGTLTGVEGGCLCMITGTANWQQGFATFETYRGKNTNYRTHHIENGSLTSDGVRYKAK